MSFKDWWKKLDYWMKGMLIGFVISLVPFLFEIFSSTKYLLDWRLDKILYSLFNNFVRNYLFLVSFLTFLGLMAGFIIKIIKEKKLEMNSPFIRGLVTGIFLILLINLIIISYCKPIGNYCLGMEYYPIELFIYNAFFIIPLSIFLSILIFIILNKLRKIRIWGD